MLLMMATLATLLRVSTRELNQLFGRTGMAIRASLAQALHSRHLQGCMGIFMTIEAIDLHRPMLLTVTGRTERHQFVIIVFARAIRVKNFMTLLAGKAVLAAGVLQVRKLAGVALPAFCWLQRRWRFSIKACIDLRQLCINNPWLGKPSQGSNKDAGKKMKSNSINRHYFTSCYLAGQLLRSWATL